MIRHQHVHKVGLDVALRGVVVPHHLLDALLLVVLCALLPSEAAKKIANGKSTHKIGKGDGVNKVPELSVNAAPNQPATPPYLDVVDAVGHGVQVEAVSADEAVIPAPRQVAGALARLGIWRQLRG